MNYYEIMFTCYHEAAHAVIGLVNNIYISKLFVKKDGSGFADFKRINPGKRFGKRKNKNLSFAWIYFNYAGIEADKFLFYKLTKSKKYPNTFKYQSGEDIICINKEINKYKLTTDKNNLSFRKRMANITRKMVVDNWDDIVLLSQYLYNSKNKKILYNDIKEILINYSLNNKNWISIFYNIEKDFNLKK
jgi:hypothetical protein